jgi:hypothetical protein
MALLGLAALTGAAVNLVGLGSVDAATIPNPVTSITVTPTNPRISDPVRTDVVWCVPDSATAGDTFQIALPAELTNLPRSFNLRDPNGVLVAVATIAGNPAVATFTFNDYVDTHTNVCGTAFFESRLSSTLVPGQTYTLTYVVNATTTFQPVITVRPGPTPGARTTARKGAFFSDPSDECRTIATGCLGWYIESQVGPFQSVTVTDNGMTDAIFECSQLTARLWTVDASGNLVGTVSPGAVGATVQITCATNGFQVVGTNIPSGVLLRVIVHATPNVLNPDGGVTYTNTASVTHVSQTGTTVVDSVVGQRRSALAGGDANGVVPPTTTTTTTTPATTTTLASAPPTPAPTTSIVAVLPPVPVVAPPASGGVVQLPATGSHGINMMMLVSVFMVLSGTSLMIAAARRPRPAVQRSSNRRP